MERTKETFVRCSTWLSYESFHMAHSIKLSVISVVHFSCNDSKSQGNITTLKVSDIHVCIGRSDIQMDILDKHSLPSNIELRLKLSGCKNPMP